MPKRPAARDVLSARRGAQAIPFHKFLKRNPKAEEFIDEWLTMLAEEGSTCDWGAKDVFDYLRQEFGCKTAALSTFTRWLEDNRREAYREHVAR